MNRTYLDHAATTPLRPEAREAMLQGFELWANPSSPHAEGRKARAALEDARARIKTALSWTGEVILTSGASEAAAIAFGQARAGEWLVSAVEHEAVLKASSGATLLPVGPDGALDLEELARQLAASDSPLVAVQSVNSETGNCQDLGAISRLVHEAGGLLMADAAQSAGKMPLAAEADMIVISAHKLGGPVGIGALLIRDYALLEASGGQERGYRRGTENLPAALGFAAALEACADPYLRSDISPSVTPLAEQVRAVGGVWLSDRLAAPSGNIHALAMPKLSGSAQLMRFDLQGFAVSQGSACSSGSLRTSHVLEAMGVEAELASRTIRLSFGWSTTAEDVAGFTEAWAAMARQGAERAA
jgi:cysteine desulfurase